MTMPVGKALIAFLRYDDGYQVVIRNRHPKRWDAIDIKVVLKGLPETDILDDHGPESIKSLFAGYEKFYNVRPEKPFTVCLKWAHGNGVEDNASYLLDPTDYYSREPN